MSTLNTTGHQRYILLELRDIDEDRNDHNDDDHVSTIQYLP